MRRHSPPESKRSGKNGRDSHTFPVTQENVSVIVNKCNILVFRKYSNIAVCQKKNIYWFVYVVILILKFDVCAICVTDLNENVQLGFGLRGEDQVAADCVAPQGLRHMGRNLK